MVLGGPPGCRVLVSRPCLMAMASVPRLQYCLQGGVQIVSGCADATHPQPLVAGRWGSQKAATVKLFSLSPSAPAAQSGPHIAWSDRLEHSIGGA